jgi:UV DNA damage repair endonuclease
MQGRMELLRRMWTKEHIAMLMSLAKHQSKSKKTKEFLAKVRAIPDSVKDSLLNSYMEKCKH